MIFHKSGADIEYEYIIECYNRIYNMSCDKDGYISSFDMLIGEKLNNYMNHNRIIEIDYHNYYCPSTIEVEIADKVTREPYVTINPKTKLPIYHKLDSFKRDRIKATVALGISPFSSFKSFCKRYPDFAKHIDEYEQYLDSDDIP